MALLVRWLAAAGGVWLAARLVPGITVGGGAGTILGAALVLGLVNALVRPVLAWLSCGLIVLTLGLFLLVLNAAMLLLAARLAQTAGIDFRVDGFLAALLGSLVISAVTSLASLLLPGGDRD
jgi:putative membrane protein